MHVSHGHIWHAPIDLLAQSPFTRPYAKCAIATKRWRLVSCAVSCAAISCYLHSGSGASCISGPLGFAVLTLFLLP